MSISLSLKNLFIGTSTKKLSNEALIQRYASKKESHVLGQLYDNCERDLFHFLLSLTDTALAEEIAQSTWLKVIEKAHLYQAQGSFKSWLFTIGRRCLIDEFRKLGRFQEIFDDQKLSDDFSDLAATEPNANTQTQLTSVELATETNSQNAILKQFQYALSALPFAQKEAFCLQQEGFSLLEIAQLTSATTETVKSRIRYAKQGLKKHLEKYRD